MKIISLFIVFSLLCPFSLVYATPSCEGTFIFAPKQPSPLIQEKILNKSPLKGENLSQLDLRGRDLSNIDLRGAVLAELQGVFILEVLLEGANLQGAKVTHKQAQFLNGKGLSGFVVEDRKIHAPFAFDADLSQAPKYGVGDADLRGAKPFAFDVDLRGANLMGADMRMQIK